MDPSRIGVDGDITFEAAAADVEGERRPRKEPKPS
jgi:hypothetical protein